MTAVRFFPDAVQYASSTERSSNGMSKRTSEVPSALMSGGLVGEFRPDVLPVGGAEFLTGYLAVGGALDENALFNRHRP